MTMWITNFIIYSFSIRVLFRYLVLLFREANRYRYMRITRGGLTRREKWNWNEIGFRPWRSEFEVRARNGELARDANCFNLYGSRRPLFGQVADCQPRLGRFGARQTCFSIARHALRHSRTSRDSNTTIYGSVTANVAHALVQASILSVEMLSLFSTCFTLVLRANYRD